MRKNRVWLICLLASFFTLGCGDDGGTNVTLQPGEDAIGSDADDAQTSDDSEGQDTADAVENPDDGDTETPEYPKGAGVCFTVAAITCGETVQGNTEDGLAKLDFYGCGFGDDYTAAKEVAYEFNAETDMRITATVVEDHAGALDAFLLPSGNGECDPSACEFGVGEVAADVKAGEAWFLVLDDFQGGAGAFTVELTCCTPSCDGKQCGDDGCGGTCGTCDDEGALCDYATGACGPQTCTANEALTCGQEFTIGELETSSKVASNGCLPDVDYGGEDMTWSFVSEVDQLLTVSLGSDLEEADVFLLETDDQGTCDAAKCLASGADEVTWSVKAGAAYFILVDTPPGMEGISGSLSVAVNCCVPQCEGLKCGDDGCGGNCGSCTTAGFCSDDQTACIVPDFLDNDTCEKAVVIGELPFMSVGTTLDAVDDYFPADACVVSDPDGAALDVTYSYTVGDEAMALSAWLQPMGDDPECDATSCTPKILYATEACPLGDGACLMGLDFFNNPNQRLRVSGEAGKTYTFVVDGYDDNEVGPFILHVEMAACTDADLATLGAIEEPDAAIAACQVPCAAEDDVAACLSTCLAGLGTTAECTACGVPAAQCEMDACAEKCDADWSAEGCTQCLDETHLDCEAQFYNCAGSSTPEPNPLETGVDADNYPLVDCPSGLADFEEAELNNTDETAQVIADLAAPGFCISGGIKCGNDGNNYDNDPDVYRMTFPVAATVTFGLDWLQSADNDFYVIDIAGNETLVDFEDGVALSESGEVTVEAGQELRIIVYCWAGPDQGYALWGTWDAE